MRIGKHIGKRAKHNNKDGYVFETIVEHNGTLFVYDDKIGHGHNAPFYFEKHPEEWNDELEGRCWYLAKDKIKILKKKVLI